MLIQLAAVGLLVAYFQMPTFREWCDAIGIAKREAGLPAAFIAGAIAGGLIPEVAKLISGKLRRLDRRWFAAMLYVAAVYGVIGISVDLLYTGQAQLFGHDNRFWTVVKKVLVDMLLFSPLFSIPLATVLFTFQRLGYRHDRLRIDVRNTFYMRRVMPGLILCWAFWIPILALTYSLPTGVQFPFAMLAESAWSVVFVFQAVHLEVEEAEAWG
ncbi:MAG: hypothetical protein HONBIEJF_02069 [Fimbriimonadaceae bacterium]|nr:hypothetical protein [Fimbriimonadaceae bacterium]